MRGNSQVRFLGDGGTVMCCRYPTKHSACQVGAIEVDAKRQKMHKTALL